MPSWASCADRGSGRCRSRRCRSCDCYRHARCCVCLIAVCVLNCSWLGVLLSSTFVLAILVPHPSKETKIAPLEARFWFTLCCLLVECLDKGCFATERYISTCLPAWDYRPR